MDTKSVIDKCGKNQSNRNNRSEKKIPDKINWICSSTCGDQILDISNFQGENAIILGREGKKTLGLFSSDDAFEEAEKSLDKEDKLTQGLVELRKEKFMLSDIQKEYDTVILGDIIEHFSDVPSLLNKAVSLVKENGRLVVTSTFGINNNMDYYRTFYLYDFLKLQSDKLSIVNIEFMNKWIGVVYQKSVHNNLIIFDDNLLKRFEYAIFSIENELIEKQNSIKEELAYTKNELHVLEEINNSINENLDYKQKFLQEKRDKIKIQKELIEQYNREEQYIFEQKELDRKYELLQHRYNNIKNSTLGKLTLKYWSFRNRRGKK